MAGPIQVNPSITAQLLRRRTAPRQGSEWFGIEMEERESYSSSTLHPFLLVKNLDKVDLSWFWLAWNKRLSICQEFYS